jgi:hypothetical protein
MRNQQRLAADPGVAGRDQQATQQADAGIGIDLSGSHRNFIEESHFWGVMTT